MKLYLLLAKRIVLKPSRHIAVSNQKTNADHKYDSVLGSGRTYAVFYQLSKIIPCLRDALSNRDYLYRTEIDEIDNILYDYDYYLIKILWIGLLGAFMDLVCDSDNTNTDGAESKDEGLGEEDAKLKQDESESKSDDKFVDESISDYSMLFSFLKKVAADFYEGLGARHQLILWQMIIMTPGATVSGINKNWLR